MRQTRPCFHEGFLVSSLFEKTVLAAGALVGGATGDRVLVFKKQWLAKILGGEKKLELREQKFSVGRVCLAQIYNLWIGHYCILPETIIGKI